MEAASAIGLCLSAAQRLCWKQSWCLCAWCVHLCWLRESWNLEMLLTVWGEQVAFHRNELFILL